MSQLWFTSRLSGSLLCENGQYNLLWSRDDPERIFTFPFPPPPFSCSQFPFIPIPKFKSYSHSHGIPIGLLPFHSQTRTAKQRRKVVSQKTGHQSLKKNPRTPFTTGPALKIRQKYFYSLPSKCHISYGGIAHRCTNLWDFFPMEIRVIPIPIYVHFCSFPFSFPSESYSPFHGILIPIGNSIPMVISTVKALSLISKISKSQILNNEA